MIEHLDRIDDPRISAYRDLRDPELMRSRGLFVAEGRLVVRRVIEDSRWQVESVVVNAAAHDSLQTVLDGIADRVPVYVCDAPDCSAIAGYNVHRGCLALVARPPAQ